MKLFVCGDVMTGRGIDQILAHPAHPGIHEQYARSALDYVHLAEAANGPIPRAVEPAYLWGDALRVLEQAQPGARIVNLETAVTRSQNWAPKGINYRMDPLNVACLAVARVDCCVLANNHVLDWGDQGLLETVSTLHAAGLRTAGAGRDQNEQLPRELTCLEVQRLSPCGFQDQCADSKRKKTAMIDIIHQPRNDALISVNARTDTAPTLQFSWQRRSDPMKRRKSVPSKKPPRLPEAQEDLNATSRALYGVADEREPEALARDAESVEDPLQDWPESASEADPWLKSRSVRRNEEREG